MCSLSTAPTPSTAKELSTPLNLKLIFAVFAGNDFVNVDGKIAKTPPPSLPPVILSIAAPRPGFAFRSRHGRNGPRRARLAAAASHRPRCGGGRSGRRRGLVRHVDLRRRPDGAHGALPVSVDGPRPLLRPPRRHDGRDDVAIGLADARVLPRDDSSRGGSTHEACG